MTIVTLAFIAILETVRRRVVAIAAAGSIVAIVAIGWGFHRIGDAIYQREGALAVESVLTILSAFAFSVVLAVGASFLAASAIAGDLESGIALAVLPRPISRTSYVLGKWLGLASLVAVFAAVAGTLAFTSIAIGDGYRAPNEPLALAFLVAQSIALFSLALALSTRLAPIAAGIVSVASFGVSWIAGITAAISSALHADVLSHAAVAVGLVIPTDGLWRGAVYALTPVTALVTESDEMSHGVNPFGVTNPPTTAFLIWTAAWVAAILWIATASMRDRDL